MSDFWARMPPFRDSNSSRRSDCSVASARNACSWVMFVFHSSRCWSSVRSSVVRCCRRSSVVLSSVVRLVVAVGRLVVGCRLSVVVVVRQSLVVGCLVGRPSSVSLPGPSASELSRDSPTNSVPPRSSRLSSASVRNKQTNKQLNTPRTMAVGSRPYPWASTSIPAPSAA